MAVVVLGVVEMICGKRVAQGLRVCEGAVWARCVTINEWASWSRGHTLIV